MPRKRQPLLHHGPSKEEGAEAHEAIKVDQVIWPSLAVDGIQSDGLGGLSESRRCPRCGSTISRQTTALAAVEILATLAALHARSLEAVVDAGAAAQRLDRCQHKTAIAP